VVYDHHFTVIVKAHVFKEFARKVLFDKDAALQEVRAIEKLFRKGIHQNLVAVESHGWIPGSPFYHIDMELCKGNLEDYIKGIRLQRYEEHHNLGLSHLSGSRGGKAGTIWEIAEHIASGISFIHGCGEVHRDLKPRNGKSHLPIAAEF
jgi:serine/threonine protein kinase